MPGRFDPVNLIEDQSADRVPELVPIRYARMSESPFRCYRGAPGVMAADLAATPVSGPRVQLCGDAHMLNSRLPASPERHLLFDINDFDETLPGPWEWDVKRLATSLVIAGRENGYTDRERARVVRAAVRCHREQMRRFAGMRDLDVWYARQDVDPLRAVGSGALRARGRRQVAAALAKARTRGSLQAKAAGASVLAAHVGAGGHATDGERVVAGQRLMQAASDIFLGWQRTQGLDGRERDFYVRQLRDWKGVAEPSLMVPPGKGKFGELCGATLARAQPRPGDRIALAAHLGRGAVLDWAVTRFAESYADQNERDHRALLDAAGTGRVRTARAA
ncbi:DUF2252 domain-containing protein [Actinacidiphila sp. ITFR-21]|uniref:DUF2252 domain-containing protein n=1 Tax=Actinacidiphila sp. ITFR-21 TaxID=3075199 RepID=UPI00288A28F8|nr:DUF2252 family protein [Streptomyces sp. ITFR-21]WNI19025.1 DUF2252 family protein [Streptomyces sp. ITFR-21]